MEKKKPRILIIGPDEYSRGAIEHLLNAKGCEVISTAGGGGVGEGAGICAAKKSKSRVINPVFFIQTQLKYFFDFYTS